MWTRFLHRLLALLGRALPEGSRGGGEKPPESAEALEKELRGLDLDRQRLRQTLEYYRAYGLTPLVRECEGALQQTERRMKSLRARLQRFPARREKEWIGGN